MQPLHCCTLALTGTEAHLHEMSVDQPDKDAAKPADKASGKERKEDQPGWADGLRKLYDSVVDEPLPDSFKDLLSQLDDTGKGDTA